MATTWNPSDLFRVSLSNANLTFTGTANQGAVRATDGKSSGKWFYESTINTNVASDTGVGIALLSASYTSLASNASGGVIAFTDFSSGAILVNGSASGSTLGVASNGDVLGIAFDTGATEFWARRNAGNWNGNPSANPATGAGGISFAALVGAIYAAGTVSLGTVVTTNFGASAFAHAAPAGFGPYSGASSAGMLFGG